jgi:hypothetical protein
VGLTYSTPQSSEGAIRSFVVTDLALIRPAFRPRRRPPFRRTKRLSQVVYEPQNSGSSPAGVVACSSKMTPHDVRITDVRRPSWLARSRLGAIHEVTRRSVPRYTLHVRRKPAAIPALQPSQNVALAPRPAYLPTVRIGMS